MRNKYKNIIESKFIEATGPDQIEALSVYLSIFSICGLSFGNGARNTDLPWS